MQNRMPKGALAILGGMLALLVFGPRPAWADELGAGTWQYNTDWSIALVNLTNYDLTYLKTSEGAAPYPACVTGSCESEYNMLEVPNDWVVAPFRTKLWLTDHGGFLVAPNSYDGRLTLYSKGFPDWKFDLVFVSQNAHGLLENGNWTGLSPHSPSQGWAVANTWSTGRWATPRDDKKMHNVMTLISPKIMVAVFTAYKNHVVVVVQQVFQAEGDTTVWDDAAAYKGNQLDFADNCGSSVPR